jgi:hypothetical protein
MSTIDIDSSVKHGLDLDALEQFVDFAGANPADVQFRLEAVGEYEGRVAHTVATTGPYTLGGNRIDRPARRYTYHLGAHKEVEEALGFVAPTDREEASEVVLAALTGCINTAVASSALVRGIVLDELVTTVSIAWDPSVFLHLAHPLQNDDLVQQFSDLHVELEVTGEGLTDEDLDYLRDSVNRSAVYNLITTANPTTPTVSTR